MKRFLVAAIAVVAITILFNSSAEAQGYGYGYRHGAGLSQGFGFSTGPAHIGYRGFRARRGIGVNYGAFGLGGFGIGTGVRPEGQPYFAINPPVYYSGIVRRPYGISPYAVPAGILPAEMQVPHVAEPVTVTNPFFKDPMPASDQLQPEPVPTKNKTTKVGQSTISNPYFAPEVQIQGQVGFASLESVVEEN